MVKFNSGFYQKRLGGNNKITSASINLGCTKGRGSITRRLKPYIRNTHMYTKRNNNYRFNIGSYSRRSYM
jgi:hypothetical protein